jgi:hypothetical protein
MKSFVPTSRPGIDERRLERRLPTFRYRDGEFHVEQAVLVARQLILVLGMVNFLRLRFKLAQITL